MTRLAALGLIIGFILGSLVQAWSHDIGEPELQAAPMFQGCCHEMDCRHYPLNIRYNDGKAALVWFHAVGVVGVDSRRIHTEIPVNFPVLCTEDGENVKIDAQSNATNVMCIFVNERKGTQ